MEIANRMPKAQKINRRDFGTKFTIVNKRLNTAAENLTTNKCKQVGHIHLKRQYNFAFKTNVIDTSSKQFSMLSINAYKITTSI